MGGSRFRGPRAKQDGGGSAGKNMADLNVMKKADVMSNGAADACDNGEKWSQEKTSNVKKKGSLMATLSRTFGKGGLKRADVKSKWKDYDETFTQSAGEGISDKERTKDGVDTFYNLVTDIYEWGWGQSFHFSPQLHGKSIAQSTTAHETRISDTLGLKPGLVCLDVGCGIGGPLCTIASHSGAKIIGVTINNYQVERSKMFAEKAGISNFEVHQGNFLDLKFPDNSMDGAYAIEATCHSPSLEQAYAEIHRVMKPGAKFVCYEWVTTEKYDPKNQQHVDCIDAINYANALPEMRSWSEIGRVATQVGFDVVEERDLALPPAGPWWDRLKLGKTRYKFNKALFSILSLFCILPKGVGDVHKMLVAVTSSLVEGGELGIFSPMYMVVLQKR